jgi:hypothetical protein
MLVDKHLDVRLGIDERALILHLEGLFLQFGAKSAELPGYTVKRVSYKVDTVLLKILQASQVGTVHDFKRLNLMVGGLDGLFETLAGDLCFVLDGDAVFVDP